MKKYQILIFDLDGTLSNSQEGITKSMQYALDKIGIVEQDLSHLKHFIGPPLADELKKTYDISLEEIEKCVAFYRERYVPIGLYETEIYEGAEEMLRTLKAAGQTIAMATSKPQMMAEEVLKYLKIDHYFDAVMGAQLHGPRQSKQAVLEALFDTFHIKDRARCVMIGDTCYDVNGALAAGIPCIGVAYGFGERQELLDRGALEVAENTIELTEILLKET